MSASSARTAALHARQKAAGLCKNCTRPAVTATMCEFHRRKIAEYRRRLYRTARGKKAVYAANKRFLEKRKSAGLCVLCDNPARVSIYCEFHRQKQNERTRSYYRIRTGIPLDKPLFTRWNKHGYRKKPLP